MSIETKGPEAMTQEKLTARNELQKLLLEKAVAEGVLDSEQNFDKMIPMFKTVSDIIDGDDPSHDSIRAVYEGGDYDGAVKMILKLEEIKSL